MNYLLLFAAILDILGTSKGFDWTCIIEGYHQCDGFDKCCHDGEMCLGENACLAIGAIVGICITVVFGMVTIIVVIYLCKRQKRPTVGTVFSQPAGTTTVTTIGQQQTFAQPQFGQPTAFIVQQPYVHPLSFIGTQSDLQQNSTTQQQNYEHDPVYPPPT